MANVGGPRTAHLEPDAHGPRPGHHAGTQSGPSMRGEGGRRSEGTVPNLGTANLQSGSEEDGR